MDEAVCRHYVGAVRLLLFLSALLAGLTGAISGECSASVGQVQQEARAHANREATAIAVASVAQAAVIARTSEAGESGTSPPFVATAAAPLRNARLTSERRLE